MRPRLIIGRGAEDDGERGVEGKELADEFGGFADRGGAEFEEDERVGAALFEALAEVGEGDGSLRGKIDEEERGGDGRLERGGDVERF